MPGSSTQSPKCLVCPLQLEAAHQVRELRGVSLNAAAAAASRRHRAASPSGRSSRRGSFGSARAEGRCAGSASRPCHQGQGKGEQHDAGKIMREALPDRIAEIIGQQDQHEHADEIGQNRDRQDCGNQQRRVAASWRVQDIDVKQADRRQSDDRIIPEQASSTSSW